MYKHLIIAAALKGTVDYTYECGPWKEVPGQIIWHDHGIFDLDNDVIYKVGDIIMFPSGKYVIVKKLISTNVLIKILED